MVVQQHIPLKRVFVVLALSALVLFAAACKDDSKKDGDDRPVRSCMTVLRYTAEGPVQSLYVAGSFNGWSDTVDRMTDPDGDGVFTVELSLGAGDHSYKFVLDGDWILDPANPYRIWEAGVENSRLMVGDCHTPKLELLSIESAFDDGAGNGSIVAEVQYVDSADRAGPDPASISLAVNSQPSTSFAFDPDTWIIRAELTALERNKYNLVFSARDLSAVPAEDLRAVSWVEPGTEPFDWRDTVIYFVFTDRFRNGDVSNDEPAAGVAPIANYAGGDYAGVIMAIEEGYFDDLGVNALWLSPPQTNPDGGFPGYDGRMYTGYHGYWPSRPRESQRRFGTLDELKLLTGAAHRRGIRVIADAVLNHVHSEHPYFTDHFQDGWFHGDGSCVCGGPGCDWDTHKLDCWFTDYLPDFNYSVPAVTDQVVDDMEWWAREADLDGFRCDAVKHMRHVAAMTLSGRLDEVYEPSGVRTYLVGETFTGEDGRWEIAEFIGPHELDGQFDFPIFWAMLDTFGRYGRNMAALDGAVAANEGFYPPDTVMSPFLGNHDVPRFFSHANGDIADLWGTGSHEQGWNNPPPQGLTEEPYRRVMLGFLFLLTMPGAPLIYYGDEIGLPGAGDPDNRRPMRFGSDLTAYEQMVLDYVRQLGQIRKQVRALRRGTRTTLLTEDDAYAYARFDRETGEAAVIVINRAYAQWSRAVYLPAQLDLPDGTVLEDLLGGPDVTVTGGAVQAQLEPQTGAIYVAKE
jgi:glycosidase